MHTYSGGYSIQFLEAHIIVMKVELLFVVVAGIIEIITDRMLVAAAAVAFALLGPCCAASAITHI